MAAWANPDFELNYIVSGTKMVATGIILAEFSSPAWAAGTTGQG